MPFLPHLAFPVTPLHTTSYGGGSTVQRSINTGRNRTVTVAACVLDACRSNAESPPLPVRPAGLPADPAATRARWARRLRHNTPVTVLEQVLCRDIGSPTRVNIDLAGKARIAPRRDNDRMHALIMQDRQGDPSTCTQRMEGRAGW